jgi:hypothetical protein
MSARSIQARLAAETRYRPDEDHSDLRRQLKAEQLADYIRRTVDAAPPLTPEQRNKLALLLQGGGRVAS